MTLEKTNKKELIIIINDLTDDRDRFKKLYGQQVEKSYKDRNQINNDQIRINDYQIRIKELEEKVSHVKKVYKMEVASTLQTARFLIDSFQFDTFTHRQKDNLANRYSMMLKEKERIIINGISIDESMPF